MLDYTIQYSLNISQSVAGASSAIVLGWTIIRDVFNMMFIFVIIWVAIATMLDISKWSAKQMLTKIILAAVLINFSFFITEVIIDAGNIFGAWFYNGIITTLSHVNGLGAGASASVSSATGGISLSAGIAAAMGVFGIDNANNASQFANFATNLAGNWSLGDNTQILISAFLRLGIIVFASYIFAYVAVLFIARTVSLLFALVLSPVGFAGSLLPQTQEYAHEWWGELRKNVLLAPIFLLFLYVIIAFTNTSIFQGASNVLGVSTNSNVSAIDPVQYFKYFLLAGMLLYALKAAKKQSGHIGDSLGKMANQLGQLAAGAAVGIGTGGVGIVARSTIGRGAGALSNNENLQQYAAGEKGNFISQFGARQALKATSGLSKSSFDVRGSDAFKGLAKSTGLTSKGLGVDLSKPVLSYQEKKKDIEKNETEFGKLLGRGVAGEQRRATYGAGLKDRILYNVTGSGALAEKVGEDITETAQKGVEREAINAKKKELFKLQLGGRDEIQGLNKQIREANENLAKEAQLLGEANDPRNEKFNMNLSKQQQDKVDELKSNLEKLNKTRTDLLKPIDELNKEIKDLQSAYKITQKLESEEDNKGGGKKKGKGDEEEDEGGDKPDKK